MRTFLVCTVIMLGITNVAAGADFPPFAVSPPIYSEIEVCKSMVVNREFRFRGKTLEETPDIRAMDLRLANQLLSANCGGYALKALQDYQRVHPDDYEHRYVTARLKWMQGDPQLAEAELQHALRANPDFLSAKVLLAGLRFQQGRFEDARSLIDEVKRKSPRDLWVYMHQLRFESRERPSRKLRAELLEILRNPAFPPNARDSAAELGMSLPRQSNEEVEEFMWRRLDVISTVTTEYKLSVLAERLSEVGDRFGETRLLLETRWAKDSGALEDPHTRMLLAQAYLIEAATIAPTPVAANDALVDQATVLLRANFNALRDYVVGRPQAERLAPFLKLTPKPETVDATGRTAICNAVRNLDIEGVLAQLDRGANPNGKCEGRTLLGQVMLSNPNTKNRERQAITRILLSRDGEPSLDELSYCGQLKSGDCGRILLPILEGRTQ